MTEDNYNNGNTDNNDTPDKDEVARQEASVVSKNKPSTTKLIKRWATEKYNERPDLYKGIGIGVVATMTVVGVILLVQNGKKLPQIVNINKPMAVAEGGNACAHATATAFGGPQRKLVENLDTGEIFKSVTKAAESVGVSVPAMSKHVNGYPDWDNLNGQHFAIVGLGTK